MSRVSRLLPLVAVAVGGRQRPPELGSGRALAGEAFIALGQSEIPAIVIEASEEDCYVMSLVETWLAATRARSSR
jgi:hypothetical protein